MILQCSTAWPTPINSKIDYDKRYSGYSFEHPANVTNEWATTMVTGDGWQSIILYIQNKRQFIDTWNEHTEFALLSIPSTHWIVPSCLLTACDFCNQAPKCNWIKPHQRMLCKVTRASYKCEKRRRRRAHKWSTLTESNRRRTQDFDFIKMKCTLIK